MVLLLQYSYTSFERNTMNGLYAVDFFCSGGGMTHGFLNAGINVLGGIDNDPQVRETYEKNNPGVRFLEKDVFKLQEEKLQSELEISRNDDNLIFIGCSPCQYWSVLSTDKTKSTKTKDLLKEFQRFILYFNPGYVVVENVPGLEHKAEESGLQDFIDALESRGYIISSGVYKLNEYGVPQTRRRFSLIASRVCKSKIEPKRTDTRLLVKDVLGCENGFPLIEAGHKDASGFRHTAASLNKENSEVIRKTPRNGGNSVKNRSHRTGTSFNDSYSRMSWDKPAPTITTRFYSFSNGRFGHPEEDRAISLREGASLQTFPKDYVFYADATAVIARMIGNAVPPEFAKRIGEALIDARNATI